LPANSGDPAIKKIIQRFEEILGSGLLVAMLLITLFNIMGRYLFGQPLSWAEEVATYLFVWLAMIGAALALKTRQHFMIAYVIERLKGRGGDWARIGVAGLIVLACAVVFINGMIYMSWGWNAVTPATEISRAIPYSAVAVGGGLMLIRSLGLLREEIRQLHSSAGAGEGGAS
jgi:TRAP-type C4-dicarboxylate transport system permease small subunit